MVLNDVPDLKCAWCYIFESVSQDVVLLFILSVCVSTECKSVCVCVYSTYMCVCYIFKSVILAHAASSNNEG